MTEIQAIARTILDGFDKHYRLFREISAGAREHFENRDWEGLGRDSSRRILMYEQRVSETVEILQLRHPRAATDYELWPEIKLAYVGLLLNHLQVEYAEGPQPDQAQFGILKGHRISRAPF